MKFEKNPRGLETTWCIGRLRGQGEDVVTLVELGLRRMRNGDVLSKAIELNRIVLTYDRDFMRIARGEHPGVVVVRIHPNIGANVLSAIDGLLTYLETKPSKNRLIIINKDRISSRKTIDN